MTSVKRSLGADRGITKNCRVNKSQSVRLCEKSFARSNVDSGNVLLGEHDFYEQAGRGITIEVLRQAILCQTTRPSGIAPAVVEGRSLHSHGPIRRSHQKHKCLQ